MLDYAELQYATTYGPDENCTLALCPASISVYEYRPTLGGNAAFIAVFGIAMIIHVAISIKWRSVFFGVCLFTGCVCELIGYGGRIMLYNDPFSFNGFLIQISM